MTSASKNPKPEILRLFAEPTSLTQAAQASGKHRENLWAHLRQARDLGLVSFVGKQKDRLTCCKHKLFQLTPEGKEYLRVVEW